MSVSICFERAIEHDQSMFEFDDRFMPKRFLDLNGKLKPNYETSAFGFGRRGWSFSYFSWIEFLIIGLIACPGSAFAERLLWMNIATMLWTFDICPSDEIVEGIGLPFQYGDSDAAFNGDVSGTTSVLRSTLKDC